MVTYRGAVRSAADLRVLLVEDNRDDQALFASALSRCADGARLETFDRADVAFRRLERALVPPPVVFVDVHLPGMPSLEFVRRLRERHDFKTLRIIAITGDISYACVPAAHLGADALLIKPVASEHLSAILTLVRMT